jgi:hypothetical protein
MKRTAIIAAALLALVLPAHAAEIRPTTKMLEDARQANSAEPYYSAETKYEYHFRNIGGHVLWCAHAEGGNGGFCAKVSARDVAYSDRAATDTCQDPDMDGQSLPHAVYGYDLDYRCVGRRMTCLPVNMALDPEGYVRSQWKVLPKTPARPVAANARRRPEAIVGAPRG